MTSSERAKARRERLKTERRCVDCTTGLAPDRITVRCPECAENGNRVTRRWQARNAGHRSAERKHYYLSLYWSNRDVYLERDRARKLKKKIDGICLDCPAESLEDNVRCGPCRDRDNARRRLGSRRATAADRAEIRNYRPIDDVVDLTRVRILRAAMRLEWFSFGELFDVLGGGDDTQRNTLQVTLGRLAKAGLFERRKVTMIMRGRVRSTSLEHQITDAGRKDLRRLLKRATVTAMSAA